VSGVLQRFWDWSIDEHASIDMPTMVGYVQRATASPVYYVGHSQVKFAESDMLISVGSIFHAKQCTLILIFKVVMFNS
jgi:hypothetical protein